jgi:hypothetical protein
MEPVRVSVGVLVGRRLGHFGPGQLEAAPSLFLSKLFSVLLFFLFVLNHFEIPFCIQK